MSFTLVASAALKIAKSPEQAVKIANIKDMAEVVLNTKNKLLMSDAVKGLEQVPDTIKRYQGMLFAMEQRELELANIERDYTFDMMTSPAITKEEIEERRVLLEDINLVKKQITIISSISKEDVLPKGFEGWSKIDKHTWNSIISSAGEHTPYIVNLINYTANEKEDAKGVKTYSNELDGQRTQMLKDLRSAAKLLNTQFYTQNTHREGDSAVIGNLDKVEFNQKVFENIVDSYASGGLLQSRVQTVLKGLSVHVPSNILIEALDNDSEYSAAEEIIKNRVEDCRQDNINRFKSFNVMGSALCVAQLVVLSAISNIVDADSPDHVIKRFVKPISEKIIKWGGLTTIDDIAKEDTKVSEQLSDLKAMAVAKFGDDKGVLTKETKLQADAYLAKNSVFTELLAKQGDLFEQRKKFGDLAYSEISAGIAKDKGVLSSSAEGLSLFISKFGFGAPLFTAASATVFLLTYKITKGIVNVLPKASDKIQTQASETKVKAGTHELGFDEKSSMVEIRKHAAQHIVLSALKEKKKSDISLEGKADVALMALISERILDQDFSSNSINSKSQMTPKETIRQSFEREFAGTSSIALLDSVDNLSLDKMLNLAYAGSMFRVKAEVAHDLLTDEQVALMNLSLIDKYTHKANDGKNRRATAILNLQSVYPVSREGTELVENKFIGKLKKIARVSDSDFKDSRFANESLPESSVENILTKSFETLTTKEARSNFGLDGKLAFLNKDVAKDILNTIRETKNYSEMEINKVGLYIKQLTNAGGNIDMTMIQQIKDDVKGDKSKIMAEVQKLSVKSEDAKIIDIISNKLSDKEKAIVHTYIKLVASEDGKLNKASLNKLSKTFNNGTANNLSQEDIKNALVSVVKEDINIKARETMGNVKTQNDLGKSFYPPKTINKAVQQFTSKALSGLGLENSSVLVTGRVERPQKRYIELDDQTKKSTWLNKAKVKINRFLSITEAKTNTSVKVKVTDKDIASLVVLAEKQKDYGSISKTMISVEDVAKRTDMLMKKIHDNFTLEQSKSGRKP